MSLTRKKKVTGISKKHVCKRRVNIAFSFNDNSNFNFNLHRRGRRTVFSIEFYLYMNIYVEEKLYCYLTIRNRFFDSSHLIVHIFSVAGESNVKERQDGGKAKSAKYVSRSSQSVCAFVAHMQRIPGIILLRISSNISPRYAHPSDICFVMSPA